MARNRYEEYFKEEMNSRDLSIVFFELCDKIGKKNTEELDLMTETFHKVGEIVLEREMGEAAKGRMTSY